MKKRQKKILIFLITSLIIVFGIGITYSIFNSHAKINLTDQNLAKFIFETNPTDNLNLPLVDFKPGDKKDYLFSVTNTKDNEISEVTVEYQLTIKTFHIAPFVIKLYKLDDELEEFILECNETYTRNTDNELVCNANPQEFTHNENSTDNYKLEVSFPSSYSDPIYADIVDYINVDIRSSQKIEN